MTKDRFHFGERSMLEENSDIPVVTNMTTITTMTKFGFVKKLLLAVPLLGFLAVLAPSAQADDHHGFYHRHGYYRHHYHHHYRHYYYRHGHRYYGYEPTYYGPRPGVHVSVGL